LGRRKESVQWDENQEVELEAVEPAEMKTNLQQGEETRGQEGVLGVRILELSDQLSVGPNLLRTESNIHGPMLCVSNPHCATSSQRASHE